MKRSTTFEFTVVWSKNWSTSTESLSWDVFLQGLDLSARSHYIYKNEARHSQNQLVNGISPKPKENRVSISTLCATLETTLTFPLYLGYFFIFFWVQHVWMRLNSRSLFLKYMSITPELYTRFSWDWFDFWFSFKNFNFLIVCLHLCEIIYLSFLKSFIISPFYVIIIILFFISSSIFSNQKN